MNRRNFILMVILLALSGVVKAGAEAVKRADGATTAAAERPNLLPNGGFDAPGIWPARWEKRDLKGAERGIGVVAGAEVGEPERGRVLRFTMAEKEAATTGLMLYSEPVPVEQGKTYQVSVDLKSEDPVVFVFMRGYTTFRGQEREIYNKKQQVRLPAGKWGTWSYTFTPRSPMGQKVLERRKLDVPVVDRVRVELYAYLKPGVIWFDNVRLTEVPDVEKTK